MLDRRVNFRQLGLEVSRPRVELTNQNGKLSENVSINDCAKEQAYTRNGDLKSASWSAIVSSGEEYGRVQRHKVLIVDCLLVYVVPVIVVKVHRWNPLLGGGDNHPPDAAEAVQVDDEEEDKFVQFQEGFEFLC